MKNKYVEGINIEHENMLLKAELSAKADWMPSGYFGLVVILLVISVIFNYIQYLIIAHGGC